MQEIKKTDVVNNLRNEILTQFSVATDNGRYIRKVIEKA